MRIAEAVPLAGLTTFGIGGPAKYFAEARNEQDVVDTLGWARERALPVFVLGGGSNLLVSDSGFAGLVLQVKIEGIQTTPDGLLDAGAGESWEALVDASLRLNCAGIECLAGIPGSVGGTPVQNVGAYGQEVAQTITSVRAYDKQAKAFVELSNVDCEFRYRESRFNTSDRGRYIVTRVRFQLRPGGPPTLRYLDLKERFGAWKVSPTLEQVAAAVREIRLGKGMLLVPGDPDCRSAGSFFKNPIVADERLAGIAAAAGVGTAPHWPAGEGWAKLPAAWLLEQAGFGKGYGTGPVRISSRHTLALTNRGGASFADVEAMEAEIVHGVRERFGVTLEREPVVLR